MLVKKISKTQAELKAYGSVGGWFLNGDTITDILDRLEEEGITDLTLRLHSYGGSVFEGDVVGGAFARSKMKINVIIDGIAASMACIILSYIPKENITIAENGFGMVHRPTGGSNGDATDHLHTAKLLMDIEGNFLRTLAQRTGKPADEIKSKFFDGKDHWLNADEMIEFGLVGRKISSIATIKELDKQRIEQMTEESVYGHFAALTSGTDIPQNKTKNEKMKKELIETFGLEGVTAESSDTAVLAALQAKFKSQNDRLTALETKAKAEKEAGIKTALDAAEKAGKITAATRPTYQGIGETSGVEALNTVLASIGTKTPIAGFIRAEGGNGANPQASKDWKWYQANDPKALEKMPVEDPATFKALFKAEYGVEPEV
ncbi:MAG: Clp protease ClpP [Mangrovibacterium sp.]